MDLENMKELTEKQMWIGMFVGLALGMCLVVFSCVQMFQYLECEKTGRPSCFSEAVLS